MVSPIFYLRLTFLVSVALLVLLTWQSYDRIQSLIQSSDDVEHANNVILKAEQIMSLAKDAETGQRGYLLTHRREFLEPYLTATRKLGRNIEELDSLTNNNPRQRIQTDSLRQISERHMSLLNFGIINDTLARRTVALNRTELMIQGKVLMDDLRRLTANILQIEVKLQEKRREGKGESEEITPKYMLIMNAVALGLLVISFLLANRELRQRLLTGQELEQKIDALNRSNAELEQFAYVASHDLQEPLRKIRAFGDRLQLKHKEHLNEDGRSLLNKIENSAARMQVLIDDLLDFSRLVNQKGEVVETNLDLLLRDVLVDLNEPIKAKKAEVQVLSPLPTLPAYPTQVRQLFQNLLTNALKFSRDDIHPQVQITSQLVRGTDLRAKIPNCRLVDYHQIVVRDNGIGFDPQYADKIFVIFQRLHGRSEFSGTGIGLAVCQRVVANHQGYIKAQSTLGEGAEFCIYLPVPPPNIPA